MASPGEQLEPWVVLFIDTLIQRVGISEQSRSHLLGLYQIGTSSPSASLSQPNMMCWMLILAHILAIESRSQLQATQLHNYESVIAELKGVVADISVRLDNGFALSPNQKATIRHLAQQLVISPTRTCYKVNLITDMEKKMRAKPSAYAMDNVFGINRPRREDAWSAEARRQCSAVRNTFRKEIRDGLAGRKKCTVQQFTSQMITRYRLGVTGEGHHSEQTYLIRFVILRRFHWENVGRLGDRDESVPEADEAFDTIDESPTDSPCDTVMGKKRKTLHNKGMTSGRVSDGNDYWAQVDSWFATRILEWSSDFTSSQWREFIEESLLQDDLKFNKHVLNTTLLSSTTVSRPTTPSPAPPSNPLVHTSSNPFLQASNTQGTPESYVVNDNWLAVILNSQATNE